MIVEFIGATGAGKTTLARGLVKRGVPARQVRMATDLVTDRLGRRSIDDPHVINLLADVSALPSFIRSLDRDRDFIRFAFDRSRRATSTGSPLKVVGAPSLPDSTAGTPAGLTPPHYTSAPRRWFHREYLIPPEWLLRAATVTGLDTAAGDLVRAVATLDASASDIHII